MKLFSKCKLGRIELENRAVMAPMTRSRAIDNAPNELMRDYYAQRAQAGLIITEGIAPSKNALGYPRIPGLFDAAHVAGFRAITDAVHAAGAHIFAQLMHVGRIAHELNMPRGARIVAPSAVRASGMMYTDQQGPQPFGQPIALDEQGLAEVRNEFERAATLAIDAGFDGIELHGANGYLLNQFLHPKTNQRTDRYGGSPEARVRFVSEVVDVVSQAIGSDRVGIRLSPFVTFNDLSEVPEEEQYRLLARSLPDLAYVHVVDHAHADYPKTLAAIREEFAGPLIRNGGYDLARAEQTLSDGQAELISFGRPFIANPDLVARFKAQVKLAEPDPSTFYTPGARGYVDYGADPRIGSEPSA